MITSSDIVFTLSGGSVNVDPSLSLGGDPSSQPILGTTNNIFGDVSQLLATVGHIDYRCFYVFNNNSLDSLFDAAVYIKSEVSLGATVQIGVTQTTDAQKIVVTGSVSSGSFTIGYEGDNAVVNYDSDLATWGNNLVTALNSSTELSGVSMLASGGGGSSVFDLLFEGDDDNRNHSLLTLTSNDLGGTNTIVISKVVEGSPINSIPPEVDFATTEPNNVTFFSASDDDPIIIGTLKALDGVPIWIKRTTPADTLALEADGFTLSVSGNPFS